MSPNTLVDIWVDISAVFRSSLSWYITHVLVNMWTIVDQNNLSVNSWLIVHHYFGDGTRTYHQHSVNKLVSHLGSDTKCYTISTFVGHRKKFPHWNNGDPSQTKQVGKKIGWQVEQDRKARAGKIDRHLICPAHFGQIRLHSASRCRVRHNTHDAWRIF